MFRVLNSAGALSVAHERSECCGHWFRSLAMTYIVLRAVLAIPTGRLRRTKLAPAVHRLSHGLIVVREAPRVLNKKPRTAMLTGVFYLEAWR